MTDVVMPKMLSKEVAERVRAAAPGVRAVYMSGYTPMDCSAPGHPRARGVILIEKPFSKSALLAKLREVLAAPG